MGITTIGPSDRERQQRQRELATAFQPKAAELKKLAATMDSIRQQLATKLKPSARAGLLDQLLKLFQGASALCRGSSSLLKEWSLASDITYVYNLVRSLSSAHHSLSPALIKQELDDLTTRMATISRNIGLMYVANQDLTDAEQPAGQPLGEGEASEYEIIDPSLDDAPDTLDDLDMAGISQFAEFDNMMPGPGNPELVKTFELPVMATFNRPTSIAELNKRGFDGVDMAGYIVLRRAYLIGINLTQCTSKELDPDRVLAASLAKLGDKLNDEVALVCETGIRYHKGGWLFYWFGPATYHQALGGRLDTRLTVTEFKFPFGKQPVRK